MIGFNPDKKYLVSPQKRAELLRKMIEDTAANVEVEGSFFINVSTTDS